MKYKPGDKVRIKSLDWYETNKDGFGLLHAIPCSLYDENGNELTDENIFTSKVHFKCKCDKCGHETLLTYDPDWPSILY